MLTYSCRLWFWQQPEPQSTAEGIIIYGATILLGAGGSTLLVTSLSMVADLIGCTTVSEKDREWGCTGGEGGEGEGEGRGERGGKGEGRGERGGEGEGRGERGGERGRGGGEEGGEEEGRGEGGEGEEGEGVWGAFFLRWSLRMLM